jgi:hypothetical protein
MVKLIREAGEYADMRDKALPPGKSFAELDRGTPGGSALAEHRRRHPDQPLIPFKPRGRLPTVLRAMESDPTNESPSSWSKGEEGEVRVGSRLERILGERAVVLHDRSVPGTRGNIDHLAIAPSGVWIIDSKHYKGSLEIRTVRRGSNSERHLFVGGRDRHKDTEGFDWQERAVAEALSGISTPIHRALCFVEVKWPLFSEPYRLGDVWIIWAKALAKRIAMPGPLDRGQVEQVSLQLAAALPAKK